LIGTKIVDFKIANNKINNTFLRQRYLCYERSAGKGPESTPNTPATAKVTHPCNKRRNFSS
jgi:hypothetical protein